MIRPHFALFFIALLFVITGCSQNGTQPILPDNPDIGPLDRATGFSSGRDLLGYWQCTWDSTSNTIVAVPARTALVHVNVVKLLNTSMGLDVEVDPDLSNPAQGLLTMTVSITHPYPGQNKLVGFDVRGIMITTGSASMGEMNFPVETDGKMLNPDGYTRWWNPVEFPVPGLLGYTHGNYGNVLTDDPPASCINPYKLFCDALTGSNPLTYLTLFSTIDPNGRTVFRAGNMNNRIYEVKFPMVGGSPEVIFNYAIDASWKEPLHDPPNIPIDFPPDANAPEAFIFKAEVTQSTLWSIEGSGEGGGEIEISIELWDWQGWMDSYENQIGEMVLFSPYCDFDIGVVPDVSDDGKSATLTATIPGLPVTEGEIPIWVGVTCPGTSYKQGAPPAPNEPVAAFDLVYVDVQPAECINNGNNNCGTSVSIAASEVVTGILCLNTDNSDWFSFSVPPAGSASGTIQLGTYGISYLSLLLYKGCPGEVVDVSQNPQAEDEEIVLDGLGPGEYYISVVCMDNGDTSPRPYVLETNIEGLGEECTFDSDNLPPDADSIALDGQDTDSVCLIGDPMDWYTFEVSYGAIGFGSITLENNSFADNDFTVFGDPIGDPLFMGNSVGTDDEFIDYVILEPGTYYVRVDAMGVVPPGDRAFTLTMDLEELVSECDDQDGNNTPELAESIDLSGVANGTVCFPSDPDWYTFEVTDSEVTGSIELSSFGMSDCDLALFDSQSGTPIAESATIGYDNELIEVEDLEEGTYFIRCTASDDPGGEDQMYGLVMQLQSVEFGPVDFFVHAHIVQTSGGSDPAIDEATVISHVNWVNEFYGIWLNGSVTLSEISYINNTAWLSMTLGEGDQLFNQNIEDTGEVHVVYVNDAPDMPGAAAYCWMECQFAYQYSGSGIIVMTDWADDPTLAHEMGHGVGLLADMYMLDFYDCADLTWCPYGPSDIYCDESDAVDGNLMDWPNGIMIDNYWISDADLLMLTPEVDSQGENYWRFHTLYPNNYHKP